MKDEQRARVFISYSRADRVAAEQIRDTLIERGFDAYLDIHDIAPGEPWRERLGALIASAEKTVFLISSDSIDSEICEWEVNEAERLGKSVTPVVIRETAVETIPPRLSRLNFVFLRDEAERTEGLAKIEAALTVDLAWEREKTRVNDLAEVWDKADRPRRLLSWRDDAIRALERWRDSRPPTAPAPTETQLSYIFESRLRYTRRQRGIRAILAAVALVTSTAAGVAYWQSVEAERARVAELAQRREAETQRLRAEAERDTALVAQSRFLATVSNDELRRGDAVAAVLAALAGAPDQSIDPTEAPLASRPATPQAELALARAFAAQRERVRLLGHSDGVRTAAFSGDGRRLITGSHDGAARVWDAETGDEISVLKAGRATVFSVSLSADGARAITASHAGELRIWDADLGKPVASLPLGPGGPEAGTFSAVASTLDATKVAAASKDGAIRLWDLESRREPSVLTAPGGTAAKTLTFSADGTHLAATYFDDPARIWAVKTRDPISTFHARDGYVSKVALSSDGSLAVSTVGGGEDPAATLWDASTGTEIATAKFSALNEYMPYVSSFSFSPGGDRIAFALGDGTARIWNLNNGDMTVLEGHTHAVSSVAFSPDGGRVATASSDDTARIWDTETGKEIDTLERHGGDVYDVVFSPDGTRIVSVSSDGTAWVWRAKPSVDSEVLISGVDGLLSAAFSPDGRWIVTTSDDNIARIWSAETGVAAVTLSGHASDLRSARFSPDSKRLVTASADGAAIVWDATSGRRVARFEGDGSPLWSAVFGPDGRVVAATTGEGMAYVWNAWGGGASVTLSGHIDLFLSGSTPVYSAAFSAEGMRVVTASGDGTARLWDVATGRMDQVLAGHDDAVFSAGFIGDGTRLMTRSWDRTVRIWDVETGAEVTILKGHRHDVWSADASSDGQRVVTASADGTAMIWDTSSGATIAILRGHTSTVRSAEFGPDNLRIVTGSNDGTARIWDAYAGGEIDVLDGHTAPVVSARFSPDGGRVITASRDGTVRLWHINQRQNLVDRAKRATPYCLTLRQREELFLKPEPPRWCVTGPGREATTDPSNWRPKWPYQTAAWRNWLLAKDRGRDPPLPE